MAGSTGGVTRGAVLRSCAAALTTGALAAACAPVGGPGGNPVQVKEDVTLTAVLRPNQLEQSLQQQAIALFTQKYPNIKVDPVLAASDVLVDKTDALVLAGTPPALWWPGGARGYRYYASRGLLQELDAYVGRDRYDLSDFYPRLLTFCRWNGKLTCLPKDVWPGVLTYNKTILEREQIPLPTRDWNDKTWTATRYMDAAVRATKRNGDTIVQGGTDLPFGGSRFLSQVFGGDWYDPDAYTSGYPKQFAPQRQAVTDGVQWVADARLKLRAWPTDAEMASLKGGNASLTSMQTGKVAFVFATPGSNAAWLDVKDFQWGIAAVPVPPTPPGLPRNHYFLANQWCTFKGVPNTDAAWLLVKHMTSPEALRLWPLGQGILPSRKSLATEWSRFTLGKSSLTDADVKVVVDAVDQTKISDSHAIVESARIFTEAIKPEQDKVLSGDEPMSVAMAKMAPLAENLIKETTPK
jgi:multiple sugar transport system substrate-binding protein